jgi:hypothetical protein
MPGGNFIGFELKGGSDKERAPALSGGHFDGNFPAFGKIEHIFDTAAEIKSGGTRQSAHEFPVPVGFLPAEPVVEMNDGDPLYSKCIFQAGQHSQEGD